MKILLSESGYKRINNWFKEYVHSFYNEDPEIHQNIILKEEHTYRVCSEILSIGKELLLGEEELRLAAIIALLHDIGRFEQFTRYRTFRDEISEDHAELGIKVIERENILQFISGEIREIIIKSIQYHNKLALPNLNSEILLFYARLIRDADKLDIWKIVIENYSKKNSQNGAIAFGMPDTPGFSKAVVEDLINKKSVGYANVRNVNDFKLLQVGWVYDLNFKPALVHLKERGYLELLQSFLPESEKRDEIFRVVHHYLDDFNANFSSVPNQLKS